MPIVNTPGYAHVRLTVTDIARSKAFYDEVFGFEVYVDNSGRIDEPGITESQADFYGGTIYKTPERRPARTATGRAGRGHLRFRAHRPGPPQFHGVLARRLGLRP